MAYAGCQRCVAALLCVDAVCVDCVEGWIDANVTTKIVDELHMVLSMGETRENSNTWEAERNERGGAVLVSAKLTCAEQRA